MSRRVGFVDQPAQGGRPPQHRVDLFVIVRVITVVGRRLKDRREVDGVHTQVDEIIEVLDDADQVTPLIAVIGRRCAPLVQVPRLRHRQRPRKAVGKDLVENRVANPVGRLSGSATGSSVIQFAGFISVAHRTSRLQ